MSDQPVMPPQTQTYLQAPPKTGTAIGALVCGILGFCIPGLGLVGLILGIVAVVQASNDPARYGGKGMAIGGICTGGVSLVFIVPMMIAILLPSLAHARELAKRTTCQANMQGLGLVLLNYAAEHDGAFPTDPAQTLANAGMRISIECPSSGGKSNYRYIPGWSNTDRPDRPIIYEPIENHGGEGGNVLFIDGHVEFVPEARWSTVVQPHASKSVPISPP
jgi:prepilin-type processing-associated H-X9-DG protein